MPRRTKDTALVAPPIVIGRFSFEARRCVPIGKPTFEQWQTAFAAARMMEDSASFWLGDLLNYGEATYGEKYTQAIEVTGLKYQTLADTAYVARSVNFSRRRESVPFAHHREVAALEPAQQTRWLERAEREGWSKADLRTELRREQRVATIDPGTMPDGPFRVFSIDPPWAYEDSGVIAGTSYGRAEAHYPTMSIGEICDLPIGEHATDDAVLFLWTTAPILLQTPGPREVIAAWNFRYKTNVVWDKVEHNFGHYVSVRHEHLLICTRGSCTPDVLTPMIDSVQAFARSDVHSQKPEEFRAIIDRLYPLGPRLEVFAREAAPDPWVSWGDQIGQRLEPRVA